MSDRALDDVVAISTARLNEALALYEQWREGSTERDIVVPLIKRELETRAILRSAFLVARRERDKRKEGK